MYALHSIIAHEWKHYLKLSSCSGLCFLWLCKLVHKITSHICYLRSRLLLLIILFRFHVRFDLKKAKVGIFYAKILSVVEEVQSITLISLKHSQNWLLRHVHPSCYSLRVIVIRKPSSGPDMQLCQHFIRTGLSVCI